MKSRHGVERFCNHRPRKIENLWGKGCTITISIAEIRPRRMVIFENEVQILINI